MTSLSFCSLEEAWGPQKPAQKPKSTLKPVPRQLAGDMVQPVSESTQKAIHSTTSIRGSQETPRLQNQGEPTREAVYSDAYCDMMINYIQSCPHCIEKMRSVLRQLPVSESTSNPKPTSKPTPSPTPIPSQTPKPSQFEEMLASYMPNRDFQNPNNIKRKNDTLAYVPFNMEPEVFNVLLFSILSISFLIFIDKKYL